MSTACDYCGLPVPGQDRASPPESAASEPLYCCFGCRFAAQVTQESGAEGAARWTLTRLGIAVFFTMNVVMLGMALWSDDWYAHDVGALSQSFVALLRWGSLLASAPVLLLLGPPLAQNAWDQARRGVFSTDGLLTAGVSAAALYSAMCFVDNGSTTNGTPVGRALAVGVAGRVGREPILPRERAPGAGRRRPRSALRARVGDREP